MKNLRRLTLGLTLLAGLVGSMLRLAPASPNDLSKLTLSSGQAAGPFWVEARETSDRGIARLRLSQCQRPIILDPSPFSDALPEKLLARLYPPAEWDVRYVYHRHLYNSFAELPAKFVMRLRLLFLDLTLQQRDVSDNYIFSFYAPVGCAIDSGAAIAVVDAVVTSSRLAGP